MISSYDETKLKSQYHFDPFITDPQFDSVIHLGQFNGNWSIELEEIISNARPATWETRGYKGEGIPGPREDLIKEEYDLIKAGMDPKMTITHLNWTIPNILKKMSDLFALDDCMERIHIQMPGEVWNLHIDKLQKWSPDNPSSIMRIMIQLTDWQPGQFWEYGNYHHRGWRAGEITTFDWQNVPHCTANAGYHPRVTFQITGVKTEKTQQFLDHLSKVKTVEIK